MKNWAVLCLMALLTVANATFASDRCSVDSARLDNVCVNQDWCLQSENFAFRIFPKEDLSVEYVRRLASTPDSPDMGYIIKYLMDNPSSRMFCCWLRPLPTTHSINFRWKVGLQLKSGEIVWANQWMFQSGGAFITHDPNSSIVFTPGSQGMSSEGCSFIVFCVFPDQTETGKDWRNGKVSGLVIE
jgi:hypothetical protein